MKQIPPARKSLKLQAKGYTWRIIDRLKYREGVYYWQIYLEGSLVGYVVGNVEEAVDEIWRSYG